MLRQADDRPTIGPVSPPDLHCMTLNLRRQVPRPAGHPDAWEHRRDAVVALVASEQPTVLAVQEALRRQAVDLATGIGERWEAVLLGRDRHGDGEAVGVLVDTERCTVVERRSWALSRRPLRPGSRAWATAFPRHAVGVVLDDHATGRRFLALATHLDVVSPWARLRSAQLLGRIVAESALPAVVMADFNSAAGSAPWRALADAGVPDTWGRASRPETPEVGTYAAYREPRADRPRIDGVLATETAVVSRVAVSTRRPGGVWPSDHLAVHAVLSFGASA
ncbi:MULTISPECIES: endonuclease/exonuclease/phosphatase family protein [unclassified Curtobacterium]|uniref:endonuclease/exonuclease/phosphatase family protein n=1 Tax=unclassified Curtobacterium TaxID=257496 RepID=UPI000D924749|nr:MULTISPECIES: endonuclease/exonuclease/phosphatase family protein [unclassified Curtobacterium]PYY40248.1 hydrolase [Curtobacterium sp. MCPF17_046]WIB16602.1 endonuclease/exonuclease/phosphatase family protein [Curtobacterium sp. MCPF17_050]